jgi:hypothetical protein
MKDEHSLDERVTWGKEALKYFDEELGITPDNELVQRYIDGRIPTLLHYDPLGNEHPSIPTFQKYLVGLNAYIIAQERYGLINHFDLGRLNRHTFVPIKLWHALTLLNGNSKNLDKVVSRLKLAKTYDDFESIFFEVCVAAKYVATLELNEIEFIEPLDKSEPDLKFSFHGHIFYIECKKQARQTDFATELRNEVRALALPILRQFVERGISISAELILNTAPEKVNLNELTRDLQTSISTNTTIARKEYSIKANIMSDLKVPEGGVELINDTGQMFERFTFRERSEWKGLVQCHYSKPANFKWVQNSEECQGTWLMDMSACAGIKWKINCPEIMWKLKRLSYNRIFKGLDQLKPKKENTILHVWVETEHSFISREDELKKFLNKVQFSPDLFSWIVFNETILDVTPQRRYDLIENSHYIGGPKAFAPYPPVTLVFTDDEIKEGIEFGKGAELPDLDEQ